MSNKDKRDSLYANYRASIDKFAFDSKVADVFDDMIHRSVPGYDAIIAMTGVLAERYARPGTKCYDLGASLGAVTMAINSNIHDKGCQIVAVDNSMAMVDRLNKIVTDRKAENTISVRHEDIRDAVVENASVVVLNFTLQFIAPEQRSEIIQKIYDGLLPGCIFVLSEKITFYDQKEDIFQIDMHHEFKKLHGYTYMEISQKRTALEDVLIPDSEQTHLERLKNAGFTQCYTWFQCFNFISIVAIK